MNINGMYYSILLKIYTYLKALVSKEYSTHMDPKYEFDSVHVFFFLKLSFISFVHVLLLFQNADLES